MPAPPLRMLVWSTMSVVFRSREYTVEALPTRSPMYVAIVVALLPNAVQNSLSVSIASRNLYAAPDMFPPSTLIFSRTRAVSSSSGARNDAKRARSCLLRTPSSRRTLQPSHRSHRLP